jgi:hypothetical protein
LFGEGIEGIATHGRARNRVGRLGGAIVLRFDVASSMAGKVLRERLRCRSAAFILSEEGGAFHAEII